MLKLVIFAASFLWSVSALANPERTFSWGYRIEVDQTTKASFCIIGGPSRAKRHGILQDQGVFFILVPDNAGGETWAVHVGHLEKRYIKSFKLLAIDGKTFTKEDGYFSRQEAMEIVDLLQNARKIRYEFSGTDPETGKVLQFGGERWVGLFNRYVMMCRMDMRWD